MELLRPKWEPQHKEHVWLGQDFLQLRGLAIWDALPSHRSKLICSLGMICHGM